MEEQVIEIKGAKAYTEILEIIKYLTPECLSRIPKSLINFFETYKDNTYEFQLDTTKSLEEQAISIETGQILAFLTLKYISNESQRTEIVNILQENEKKYQEELNEKYNTNNMFKSNKREIKEVEIKTENVNNETMQLVIPNEPWYKNIFNKIKRIFGSK